MRFLFLFFVATSLTALSCRSSTPQSGACVKTVAGELDAKTTEDQSIGGYLEIEYDTSLSHDPVSPKYCSVFAQFNDDLPDAEGNYPVTFWTAKHCLNISYAKQISFWWQKRISHPQLKVQPVNSVRGRSQVYDHSKVRIDVLTKMLEIKEQSSPVAFQKFAKLYEEFKDLTPEEMEARYDWGKKTPDPFDPQKVMIPDDQEQLPLMKAYHEYIGDAEGLTAEQKALSIAGQREKTSSGKSLCFDRGNFEGVDRKTQKVCFIHADLAAYVGSIRLRSPEDDELIEDLKLQVAKTRKLASSSYINELESKVNVDFMQSKDSFLYANDAWRNHFVREHRYTALAAYTQCYLQAKASFMTLFDDGSFAPTGSEGGDPAAGLCPSQKLIGEKFDISVLKAGSEDQLDFALLMQFDITLDRINLWRQIRKSSLSEEKAERNLFFHTNYQKNPLRINDASYERVALSEIYSSVFQRIDDGLVAMNNKAKVTFHQKDSGSIISINGVIPILALSSIDNQESSGGLPAIPPQHDKVLEEDIAYEDPSSPGEVFSENPNGSDDPVAVNTNPQNQSASEGSSSQNPFDDSIPNDNQQPGESTGGDSNGDSDGLFDSSNDALASQRPC